jgi:hypothetical protein
LGKLVQAPFSPSHDSEITNLGIAKSLGGISISSFHLILLIKKNSSKQAFQRKVKNYIKRKKITVFFFYVCMGLSTGFFYRLLSNLIFPILPPPPQKKKKKICYSVEFFVLSSVRRQSELRNLLGTTLCSSQC